MRDHVLSASRTTMRAMSHLLLFSLLLATYCFGTDAILTRNATLRNDPSSTHPPILTLKASEDVELLSGNRVPAPPPHGVIQLRGPYYFC